RSMERQQWDEAVRLCHALDPLLYQYCRWGRWQQVWKLGRRAAHELGDRATEAWALHQLGSVALCLEDGFAAQAYLAEAQQMRLQMEDMVGAALAQHNLAVVQQLLTRDVPRSDVAAAPAAAFVSMSQNLPYKWLALGGGALMAGVGALFGLQATSSDVSVRPRLVNFPPQLLSTTSAPRDIVVRNTTSEALTIDAIVLDNGEGSAPQTTSEAETEEATGLPEISIIDSPDGIATSLDGNEGNSSTRNDNFEIQENCTGNVLLPDATCTIDAQFMPQTVGPHASAVNIIDDGQTLKTVTLRGVGAVAEAGFRPQTLEFESFILGEEPAARTVTMRNEGAVAFTVDTVSLSKTPAFSVKDDACTGQTLDTRDTCTVAIEFSSSKAGAFDATLTVNNQTGSSIWALPISGAAQTAPSPTSGSSGSPRLGLPTLRLPPIFSSAPAPRSSSGANSGSGSSPSASPNDDPTPRSRPKLEASASAITFASQPTGRMQTQQITLNNTGTGDLYFDAISLNEGDGFAIAGTTCGLLKPGESCRVVVNFVPQTAGEFTSALDISSNIDIAPIPVTGVATAARRSPEILEFSPSRSTVDPGEAVELCYDVADAETIYLRTGGTTRSLQNASECLSVSPQATTTYTLIVQSGDERIEESVTVTVNEAAVPLSTPVSLSPGTPNDVEPIACSANSVVLQWQGTSSSYDVRLQQEAMVDGAPSWVSVLSQSVSQQRLDVSASVRNFGLHRWQVRALDAAGNASDASAWHYFLCVVE
ncbi:MAG: choice-of-anchor D domain-containing protein, partial [Elainellaceae cyanobacterium]